MRRETWTEIRIGDLGEVFTGRTPSSDHPAYFGDDFPFITPGDMHQGKFARVTERSLSLEGAALLKRIKIPANSICVSCIGWQMGEAIMTAQPSFTNQQINTIVPNGKVEPSFLYYSLRPRKQELLSLGSAAGVRTPILNKSAFCNLKVKIPPLSMQRWIADILSVYDDLIENNTRRIRILEQMAQMIYREWFVDCRFPDHEKVKMVNSEAGLIPEDWTVEPITNVAEILGGGTPATGAPEYWENGNIDWYSPSDLTAASSMFMFGSTKKITELGLKKSSARLFPANSVMMTSRATIGVVSINRTPSCTNQGFITCVPGNRTSHFHIYFWMLENKDKITSIATGATFKEINKRTFRELPIVVPSAAILSHFQHIVSPICGLIENLLRCNRILRATRDLLLPKLVSGEVSVEQTESEVPVQTV